MASGKTNKRKKHSNVDGIPAIHTRFGKCLIVPSTELTKDLSRSGVKYIRVFDIEREKYVHCPIFYVTRKDGLPIVVEKPKEKKEEFNFW